MSAARAVFARVRPERWTNPIFRRELLTLLRSTKSFVLLGVHLALSAAVVLLAWPREAQSLLVAGAISRELFGLFAMGQTFLLALLVPAVLGSSMTSEKEGETIDLLLTSPVTAGEIVVGKLLSGLCYFVLLAVVSFPILLLCFLIGGIAAADVVGLWLFVLAQIALYGLTSLVFSCHFSRTHIAVILSYVAVGVEATIGGAVYGDGIGFLTSWRAVLLAFLSLTSFPLLFALARQGVLKPYVRVARPIEEEKPERIVGLVIRRNAFPDNLIVPAPSDFPLPPGANPVLHKELQAGVYGSGSLFVRIVIQSGVVISLLVFLWTIGAWVSEKPGALSSRHVEYPCMCFVMAYAMMLAPALAARAFTNEREEETLESLALTPLPRSRIVLGKFLAVMRVAAVLSAMNSILFLPMALFEQGLAQLLVLAIVAVSATAFCAALALFLSLVSRTSLSALVSTYLVLLVIWLGPVLARIFLVRLTPSLAEERFSFLAFLSPFLACRRPGGDLAIQFLTLLGHVLLSGLAVAILLAATASFFDRVVQRQLEKR